MIAEQACGRLGLLQVHSVAGLRHYYRARTGNDGGKPLRERDVRRVLGAGQDQGDQRELPVVDDHEDDVEGRRD